MHLSTNLFNLSYVVLLLYGRFILWFFYLLWSVPYLHFRGCKKLKLKLMCGPTAVNFSSIVHNIIGIIFIKLSTKIRIRKQIEKFKNSSWIDFYLYIHRQLIYNTHQLFCEFKNIRTAAHVYIFHFWL